MDAVLGSDGGAGGGESSQTFPHGVTSMSVERTTVSNVSFWACSTRPLVIQTNQRSLGCYVANAFP
jgi:hypothetical protein